MQELVFSLSYDDIVLLLAVIVLDQKVGFLLKHTGKKKVQKKVVQLEYVFRKVSLW